MTREKALEAMDKFVAMGYHVQLSEYDLGPYGHVMIDTDGKPTSLRRWMSIKTVSIDKIDLRAIVAAADDLGLDIGFSPIQGGELSITDMPTEAEHSQQAVVGGRRKHPR